MASRVFLSYRRSDTAEQATALKVVLEQKLPGATVFVDADSINPGDAWPDRLRHAVATSTAVVALIGPHWRFGSDDNDRLSDPDDWVLKEVSDSIATKRDAFLPVFVGEDVMEKNFADLPAALSELPTIQGLKIGTGADWIRDVDTLATKLAQILGIKKSGVQARYPNPSELKSRAPRISESEFEEHKLELESLDGWVFSRIPVTTQEGEVDGTQISRSFEFSDFKHAFTFMAMVAKEAESRPHHPEWLNVWNRVDVRLRTFDADQQVTWYDVDLASNIAETAAKVNSRSGVPWPIVPRIDD